MSDSPLAITAEPSRPELAVPVRPRRPLPPLELLRTVADNTLGIFDEEVFDELVVVRRYGPAVLVFSSATRSASGMRWSTTSTTTRACP